MSVPEKSIVIIDDERATQLTLSAVLERHGFRVQAAPNASQGKKKVAELKPDLVLLDLGLPDESGLDVLRHLRAEHPATAVMILTANDTLSNAIESIKMGAFHFLSKPFAMEELLSLVRRALEQGDLVREAKTLRAQKDQLERKLREAEERLAPVAISRRMREVDQLVARVAPSEANVLLTGESGVGKEVFAAEVHRRSKRAEGPMVKLNCGAFPPNMIEAELFGYAKGAFTGAMTAFPGMLSESNRGTLFLDEITEMPVELQTRFLRVLQEREFRPLGTTKNLPADFRLVAACNRPPAQAVREGKLRQDLYFRLKTFEIEIPPLRERREDIPKLADTFLHQFAKSLDRPLARLSAEALEMMRAYSWPGNVRELQNAIEHALVLGDSTVVEAAHLPRELRHPELATTAPEPAGPDGPASSGGTLHDNERRVLLDALRRSHGNKKRAAEALGIPRPTLYAKLKRLGVPLGAP